MAFVARCPTPSGGTSLCVNRMGQEFGYPPHYWSSKGGNLRKMTVLRRAYVQASGQGQGQMPEYSFSLNNRGFRLPIQYFGKDFGQGCCPYSCQPRAA